MAEDTVNYGLPTRADIEKFASALPDNRLNCRVFNHQKQVRIVRNALMEGGREYIEIVLFCRRGCGVSWVQLVDPDNGQIVYSGNRYPPEYLATGVGRISGPAKGILRLEAIHRAT